jgi:hypothetical protein
MMGHALASFCGLTIPGGHLWQRLSWPTRRNLQSAQHGAGDGGAGCSIGLAGGGVDFIF